MWGARGRGLPKAFEILAKGVRPTAGAIDANPEVSEQAHQMVATMDHGEFDDQAQMHLDQNPELKSYVMHILTIRNHLLQNFQEYIGEMRAANQARILALQQSRPQDVNVATAEYRQAGNKIFQLMTSRQLQRVLWEGEFVRQLNQHAFMVDIIPVSTAAIQAEVAADYAIVNTIATFWRESRTLTVERVSALTSSLREKLSARNIADFSALLAPLTVIAPIASTAIPFVNLAPPLLKILTHLLEKMMKPVSVSQDFAAMPTAALASATESVAPATIAIPGVAAWHQTVEEAFATEGFIEYCRQEMQANDFSGEEDLVAQYIRAPNPRIQAEIIIAYAKYTSMQTGFDAENMLMQQAEHAMSPDFGGNLSPTSPVVAAAAAQEPGPPPTLSSFDTSSSSGPGSDTVMVDRSAANSFDNFENIYLSEETGSIVFPAQDQAATQISTLAEAEITYSTSQVLGHGAFSRVYQGIRHVGANTEDVAIKIIRIMPNATVAAQNEAAIMTGLQHPNIIQFLGLHTTDAAGEYAIVMERATQGAVEYYIHSSIDYSDATFNNHLKTKIARDAALGLTYLHTRQNPIIHYDVKPANILLSGTLTVDGVQVKIADFGVSVLRPTAETILGATSPAMRGSAPYVAPEMWQSQGFTTRSDIYSLGVCMWELFHRQRPYADFTGHPLLLSVAVCSEDRRPESPISPLEIGRAHV